MLGLLHKPYVRPGPVLGVLTDASVFLCLIRLVPPAPTTSLQTPQRLSFICVWTLESAHPAPSPSALNCAGFLNMTTRVWRQTPSGVVCVHQDVAVSRVWGPPLCPLGLCTETHLSCTFLVEHVSHYCIWLVSVVSGSSLQFHCLTFTGRLWVPRMGFVTYLMVAVAVAVATLHCPSSSRTGRRSPCGHGGAGAQRPVQGLPSPSHVCETGPAVEEEA